MRYERIWRWLCLDGVRVPQRQGCALDSARAADPEGQYPFQIEVTGTPDSQLGVRLWNNEGVHVSMGSGVIESARLDQSHTVAAAINTIDRALQLARWQWLHQQGGASAEGRAQRSLVRATGGPCDKNLDHRDAGESRCG